MNVFEKLNEARLRFQNAGVKKSGHNKFAGYTYYELADILPFINQIANELKFCCVVNFTPELATLDFCDLEGDGRIRGVFFHVTHIPDICGRPGAENDLPGGQDLLKILGGNGRKGLLDVKFYFQGGFIRCGQGGLNPFLFLCTIGCDPDSEKGGVVDGAAG